MLTAHPGELERGRLLPSDERHDRMRTHIRVRQRVLVAASQWAPMLDLWLSVQPEPSAVRSGGNFSLRIGGLSFPAQFTHVSVDLARVQWEETSWWFSSGAELVYEGNAWRLTLKGLDVPPGIYQISRLRFSLGPGQDPTNVVDARSEKNFPRVLLQVIDDFVQPAPPSEIAERVSAIEDGREKLFLRGIVADPTNPGIGRFRGFAFVTRCLVTRRMRLGQLEVFPLKRGIQSLEHAVIINQVLTECGSFPAIDPSGEWARVSGQAFPLAVVHMPLIYARNRDEAISAIERYSSAVIDVLSPRRISYGEVFAFVVENLDFPNRGGYRPGFEGYRGNLMGGFTSGEEPIRLKYDLLHVLADPMLRLFVSLYREAAAESNLDFAYLRFWNLLETIATRRIEANPKHSITTFGGEPILSLKGRPISTTGASARVYQLIKKHFQTRGLKENLLLANVELRDLWSVCQVWSGYRHATAHYGGFIWGDSEQSQQSWYPLTSQAYAEVTANGGLRDLFSDGYFMALARTAQAIVIWEIENPPSRPAATPHPAR